MHLEAPDPKQFAAREAKHAISDADLPLERGSRDHEAMPLRHEDAIHGKAAKVTLRTRLVGLGGVSALTRMQEQFLSGCRAVSLRTARTLRCRPPGEN